MHSSFAIATLLAVAGAANAANTLVLVGANQTLTFSPNSIIAAAGDTVTFQFQAKNHSLTQSSFAAPCTFLASGVNSGFEPVNSGAATLPEFTISVTAENATSPLWFYCAQTNPESHCHAGMVFAINAPTSGNKTFSAFQAAAEASTSQTSTTSSSAGSSGYGATPAASGSAASGTSTSSSSSSSSAAIRVGGSAAGALTALAVLVGFAL